MAGRAGGEVSGEGLHGVITPASLGVMTPQHASDRTARRRNMLAVRCSDGCGFKGYRNWGPDIPEKPCPRCGKPVDVGHPTRAAIRTARGGVGGRVELHWGSWS